LHLGKSHSLILHRQLILPRLPHIRSLLNIEGFQLVRQTLGFESGASIGDMKMQVRFRSVAGIADEAEHLSTTHFVAHFYPQSSGLHMRVEREMASAPVQDDMVSSYGFRSDWNSARCRPRHIFRNAVLREGDNAIRDGKYLVSVGRMSLVLFFVAIE